MVNHIAVIGSGTMGRGIAYTAALSGFHVTLQDISAQAIAKAMDYLDSLITKSVEKGYIQSEQGELAKRNLTYTTHLEDAVRDTDLVIEAVLEVMELKINLFKQIDEIAPPMPFWLPIHQR